jgi:hypothetical protein
MYPANQMCTYHIRRPDGGRISLRFTDFNVDPSDKVEVCFSFSLSVLFLFITPVLS